MQSRRRGASVVSAFLVFLLIVVLSTGSLLGPFSPGSMEHGGSIPASRASGFVPSSTPTLSVNLQLNPSQVQEGQSVRVQATATGGVPPYSYVYNNFPSGCNGGNYSSWSCNPSSTGDYEPSVQVSDLNHTMQSDTQSLDVTSSNNNGNSSNGNNSSNPFSSLLSGLGGFLTIALIAGLVVFILFILLVVGVWIIAVTLVRRLPKRGAAPSDQTTVKCASCGALVPSTAKFCPECGTGTGPKKG